MDDFRVEAFFGQRRRKRIASSRRQKLSYFDTDEAVGRQYLEIGFLKILSFPKRNDRACATCGFQSTSFSFFSLMRRGLSNHSAISAVFTTVSTQSTPPHFSHVHFGGLARVWNCTFAPGWQVFGGILILTSRLPPKSFVTLFLDLVSLYFISRLPPPLF